VSSFVVVAALDRADTLVRERASTVVPAAYFDQLVASLDEPEDAPGLARAVTAACSAGGRLVVVDAVDTNAADFYRAHDFQPSPTDPSRLTMKLSTTARALDLPWP
jgi:hypothetical protein